MTHRDMDIYVCVWISLDLFFRLWNRLRVFYPLQTTRGTCAHPARMLSKREEVSSFFLFSLDNWLAEIHRSIQFTWSSLLSLVFFPQTYGLKNKKKRHKERKPTKNSRESRRSCRDLSWTANATKQKASSLWEKPIHTQQSCMHFLQAYLSAQIQTLIRRDRERER